MMVGSVSRLAPIVADCCSHVLIPISAVYNISMTASASVTLWYDFKQLLLLFNSIHHLLPPPTLPLLLSPAFVVRRPSSATCFCHDLVACCLRHHQCSSHRPQSPSDVVALSAVSVWSCHIVHHQPSARQHCHRHHCCNPLPSAAHCSLSSRCPPAANSVTATPSLLQPLLSRLLPPALVAPSDR